MTVPRAPAHRPARRRRRAAQRLVVGLLLAGSCTPATDVGHPADDPALLGTRWELVAVEGAPVPAPEEGGEPPFLLLDPAAGQVRGYSAVNSFSGTYQAMGATLAFGPLAATRRAGPEAAMACESAFLRALEATAAHRVVAGTLELLDAEGSVLARLVARR